MELTHGLIKAASGIHELAVGTVKPGNLLCFVAKCLGGTHTRQAGFDFCVNMGGLGFAGSRCTAHTAAQQHQNPHENGDHQAYHHRQFPGDTTHDHQSAHNGHRRGQKILRAMVRQFCDLKQVRG